MDKQIKKTWMILSLFCVFDSHSSAEDVGKLQHVQYAVLNSQNQVVYFDKLLPV